MAKLITINWIDEDGQNAVTRFHRDDAWQAWRFCQSLDAAGLWHDFRESY